MSMTQHRPHEQHPTQSIRITISATFSFSLCHLSLSSSSLLFFLPSLHPPHPSLHFWLSRTSRRQGHLTAVAVETENWGIFPSPPFLYCKAGMCGVVWDRRERKIWRYDRGYERIGLAAILVEMRLKRTLLAAPRWQSHPHGQHCGPHDQSISVNPILTV